jgi:hypothetical protein
MHNQYTHNAACTVSGLQSTQQILTNTIMGLSLVSRN